MAESITTPTATPNQDASSIIFTTGSTVQIKAPMDKVFDAILETDSYSKWNTWCPSLEFPADSSIQKPGSIGTLECMMGERKTLVPVKILDVTRDTERSVLKWRGQMLPAWFGVAERVQSVERVSENECKLVQWESMSGWGVYLLKYLMGVEKQLNESNLTYANDLKAYAEKEIQK